MRTTGPLMFQQSRSPGLPIVEYGPAAVLQDYDNGVAIVQKEFFW